MSRKVFIGRWQPFHDGHAKLIKLYTNPGDILIIGIRDTEQNENNPYTVEEREVMIKRVFPDAKTFEIPDFDELIVGRKVGYTVGILPFDIEMISATEIRKSGLI